MASAGGLTFGDELASTVVSGHDGFDNDAPSHNNSASSSHAQHPLMADSMNNSSSFYSVTSGPERMKSSMAASSLTSSAMKQSTMSAYDSVNLSASQPAPAPEDTAQEQPVAGHHAAASAGAAFSNELKICVHSARKTWGPTAIPGVDEFYMSYIVSTVTTLPNYAAKELNVKRRFRDIVDLSNLLWMVYPGSFIPARPKRNMVEGRRMTPMFVQQRQAAMERFLNRLAAHPVIGRSEELKAFLEIDSDLRSSPGWQAMHPAVPSGAASSLKFIKQIVGLQRTTPTPAEVTQSTANSKDVFRMLHERMASFRGRLPHEEVPQQEGPLMEQQQVYEELRKELQQAAAKAEDLVNRFKESGEAMGDFGVALTAMHKFEEQHQTAVARPAAVAGQACFRGFKQTKAASEQLQQLLTPIQDYNDAMPCVFQALNQRAAALTTALTVKADLADTQHRLDNARGQPQPNPNQVDKLRRAEELLDSSSRAAMSEYHRIAARNMEDSRSFQANCEKEFVAMLKDLAIAQKQHWTQVQSVWADMARSLGADPRSLNGW